MRNLHPEVLSINISPGGIPKLPVNAIFIGTGGLEGDGHNHEKHRTPVQAVSLQDIEVLSDLKKEFSLVPGSTGENLTVRNLFVNGLSVGTILSFSGGVVLEVTKIRKPCYVLDSISPRLKEVLVDRCGCYAKVLKGGVLSRNQTIQLQPPALAVI